MIVYPLRQYLRQYEDLGVATYRKRGNRWRVEVCINGIRDSATKNSKAEARSWAIDAELAIEKGPHKTRYIFDEALDRYLAEVTPHKKKSAKKYDKGRIKFFKSQPLSQLRLDKITTDDVGVWRDTRLRTVGVGPSTVNREMNTLSQVFTRCVDEWKWIDVHPMAGVWRPKNPKHRDERINDDEVQSICDAMGYDGENITLKKHLVAAFFVIAIETAMRLGELCALRPVHIKLKDSYVCVVDSKNGDRRNVALSKKAVQLFRQVVASKLTIESDTAGNLYRKYRGGAEMNLDHFRFHDTRHEACTRLAKKIHVLDLARMTGHRDLKSLMIYYNPTAIEIAARLD